MRILILLALSLGLACTTTKPDIPNKQPTSIPENKISTPATQKTSASVPTTTMIEGRYFSEAGAPEPLACTQDSDCMGETVTNSGGCCVDDPFPYAQTHAYHEWLQKRRQAPVCEKAGCPPPRPPPQPPDCSFQVKCVAKKCKNSC
jgi:hypothetical protein